MNSLPLSESMPSKGNGITLAMSSNAATTHFWALFGTDRFSVQPVAISVTVSVYACSPIALPPSWPTRSISTNPVTASSHCAQVLIGIASLSSDPGLVWLRPRNVIAARSGASRRSIVAADIAVNAPATSSLTSSSPKRRSVATSSPNTGASRLPVGAPSTAQQNRNATTTSCPYLGARGRRGRATLGTKALPSALRAWLRCQPVVAHHSSRIAPFAARLARLYRVAIALVTACRWLIVSPLTETYRQPVPQPGRRAVRAHFSMSQRTHARIFDESTRPIDIYTPDRQHMTTRS